MKGLVVLEDYSDLKNVRPMVIFFWKGMRRGFIMINLNLKLEH